MTGAIVIAILLLSPFGAGIAAAYVIDGWLSIRDLRRRQP